MGGEGGTKLVLPFSWRPFVVFSTSCSISYTIAYVSPEPEVFWDNPPGPRQGVTIRHLAEGQWYEERIPHNGLVTQSVAALILDVSLMSVNNWVRQGKLKHIKIAGQPSVIPYSEVKRVKGIRERDARQMKRQKGV